MSYNQEISSVKTSSVPHIVVTEPSPVTLDNTPNAVSIVRKIVSIHENIANGEGGTFEPVKVPLEQSSNKLTETSATVAATSEPSTSCGSGEFKPAIECNDCVVPVPEQPPSLSVEDAAASSTDTEPEQDDFRTSNVGFRSSYGLQCIVCYEKAWNTIHSGYAIPFWLLLLALPVSAGYMSALYMYSCPASHSVSMLMFTIGISLMAVLSLRICLIIRRMTTTTDDFRNMLHTLLLVASFLTVVFFITESVAFWKLSPSSRHGAPEYCDPHFVTFAFWWNCVMCVVIVLIFLFPA